MGKRSKIRRRVLAGVVATLPALLLAGALLGTPPEAALNAGAAQASPSPSPTSQVAAASDTSSPTPTPSASPSDTSSPSPTPSPSPTDTPSPTPSPTPTPTPAPTPTPTLAPVTVVAPPAPAPPPASPGAATPKQVSGALVVADPLLAAQVQQVIQHPVAQQRPDLMHFSPPSGTGNATLDDQGGAFLVGGSVSGDTLLVTGVLAALLLVGAAVLLTTRTSTRLRVGLVIGSAVVVPVLGGTAAGALAVTQNRTMVHVPAAAQFLSALKDTRMPDNALRYQALQPARKSPSWVTLVGIEQAIAQDHQQLVVSENAIAAANAQLSTAPASASKPATAPAAPAPPTATPLPPTAPASAPPAASPLPIAASTATPPASTLLKPNVVTIVANQLTVLVDQHQTLATQYETDLQREYDFFVATAQSPQQQNEVVQAASLTAPDAAAAVLYDINTVQTQLAQEAAIQAAEAAAAAAPQPSVPGAFVPSGKISFHAPVGGVITQGFGPTEFTLEPPITYNGVFYPHFHTGLDIANAMDTPVGAAAAGRVILATQSLDDAGHLTGYGNYVVIEHGDGFVTLYGHLDKLLVTAGQVVKQGQVIGLLGSTGWSTGPHVHFEIRKDGVFVDPAPYIAPQIKA